MTTTTAKSPVVALLGTGTMGLGMGRNIAAAGFTLRAWNRTTAKAEPLKESGVTVVATPAEAVQGADIVITMLFDADSVAAAIEEAAPSLTPGAVWLQTSTVGVEGTERLTDLAQQHKLVLIDAPVLGTKGPVEQGTLTVLAAGPESARSTVAGVLDAVSAKTLWVGDVGAASKLKLVVNSWGLTVLGGIAQSVRMAEAFGLDPQLFLDAVAGGALDVPYVGLKGTAMLTSSYDVAFALSGAVKDATLIDEAARAAGADPALVAVVLERLRQAEAAGHGDKDMAAVYFAS